MKSWVLILAAIAVLLVTVLLLMRTRERFNYATQRPEKTDIPLRRAIETIAGTTDTVVVDRYAMAVEGYYITVYLPDKKRPEPGVIDAFLDKYLATKPLTWLNKATAARIIDHVFSNTTPPPSGSGTSKVEPKTSSSSAAAEKVDTSRTSGTTTGGTSGTTQGANSGGGSRRRQVFGPIDNGRGKGVRPMDSSKSNQYPELLGGDGGRASTRIEGGGIVDPSGVGITLPPTSSLGSDENSKYLPFSRQPGDMDIIPDPYRVSQQFSAANYSFKTEPVPFLTDFSAFQK